MVLERITFDPRVMGGRACIRGLRIPVSVIVAQIAHGASFEDILAGYPDLEREDIQQAIESADWLRREGIRVAWPRPLRFLSRHGRGCARGGLTPPGRPRRRPPA